jgi:hypothetical protein
MKIKVKFTPRMFVIGVVVLNMGKRHWRLFISPVPMLTVDVMVKI